MTRAAVETLTSAFERPLEYAAALRETGQVVVGLSSPAVPAELLRAVGCRSVVLRWPDAPTPRAEARLEAGVFSPFVKALVERAFTGGLSTLSALVMSRSSEQHYKAYLYLREFARERPEGFHCPPLLLFDLLQSGSPEVQKYVVDRTKALAGSLQELTGHPLSAEELRRQIAEGNAARSAARALQNLRCGAPRITGAEALPLLGARHVLPPVEYARLASEAVNGLSARAPLAGPRVLIAADCPDNPRLHAAIESRGAVVVGEDSAWGSRGIEPDIDVARGFSRADPLEMIAAHCHEHGDGTRRPRESDEAWFEQALADVDGVFFWLPSSGGVRGWDAPRLRRSLAARGIPHWCWRGDPDEMPDQLTAFLDAAAAFAASRDGR